MGITALRRNREMREGTPSASPVAPPTTYTLAQHKAILAAQADHYERQLVELRRNAQEGAASGGDSGTTELEAKLKESESRAAELEAKLKESEAMLAEMLDDKSISGSGADGESSESPKGKAKGSKTKGSKSS